MHGALVGGERCRRVGFEANGQGRAVPQGKLRGLWTGARGAAGKAFRPMDRGERCRKEGFEALGQGRAVPQGRL